LRLIEQQRDEEVNGKKQNELLMEICHIFKDYTDFTKQLSLIQMLSLVARTASLGCEETMSELRSLLKVPRNGLVKKTVMDIITESK
jgi:hypothetical protein